MPLKAPTVPLTDPTQWSKWCQSQVIKPDPKSITDDAFANRNPASIIGRPQATAGSPTDIVASADGQVLVRRAGTLEFDGVQIADLPTSLATDSEVSAAAATAQSNAEATAAAALAAHVAAADPHPVYLTQTEGDARYRQSASGVPYSDLTGIPSVLGMLHSGTGSPETVLTATVGHIYLRTDGGAGTTLYVKESGSGNTGWIGK